MNSDNQLISDPGIFDERKQAMLAAIVDSSDDAIISKDLNGMITSWNFSAERIFGWKEPEVLGKHISILIPPDRLSEENMIISKIKAGERVEHYETVRRRKDGTPLNISITVSPIKNTAGIIIGASKIARDITERVLIERKLKEYAEELQKLNRHKDEFIGMAGHELKTPLTSISAYLQLLEKSHLEPTEKRFLTKALQNVGKLTGLVNDLLDVSKIEAGKLQINLHEFDLAEMVQESVENFRHIAPSHQILLHNTGDRLTVIGDRTRLEQVMTNFLTNAVKYSPGETQIDVFVKQVHDKAEVIVKDYGIGVSEEQQPFLFARFYRSEQIPDNISGLGIGLYISKEIVHRHHGDIFIKSHPGKGSEFCFTLPLTQK